MIRYNLLSSIFFLLFGLPLMAQSTYNLAIGARLGNPMSVSVKGYASESLAFEAYLGTRNHNSYGWTNISVAAQVHKDLNLIDEIEGLKYYLGGGASTYFWRSGAYLSRGTFRSTTYGIQGYAGLEYSFENVPINLNIDWIPTIFLGNGYISGLQNDYGSLAIRYILK